MCSDARGQHCFSLVAHPYSKGVVSDQFLACWCVPRAWFSHLTCMGFIASCRANEQMTKAAQMELMILKKLLAADPENKKNCSGWGTGAEVLKKKTIA